MTDPLARPITRRYGINSAGTAFGFTGMGAETISRRKISYPYYRSLVIPRPSRRRISIASTAFLKDLAPPPFPFPVDQEAAHRGEPLFQTHCASCHAFGEPYVGKVTAQTEVRTDAEFFGNVDPKIRGCPQEDRSSPISVHFNSHYRWLHQSRLGWLPGPARRISTTVPSQACGPSFKRRISVPLNSIEATTCTTPRRSASSARALKRKKQDSSMTRRCAATAIRAIFMGLS